MSVVRESPGPEPVSEHEPLGSVVLGSTGKEIYRNTEPIAYADADTDYAWRRFVSALSELLDPIAEITRPTDGTQRWQNLASPRRCPSIWLPILAQWAGVRRPDALSEEELRDLIGPTAPGMWRGTRQAMIAAVRRFLPPGVADRYIYFEERADGDAYALRVFTYEFIEHDARAIREALLHAKPAGLWPFEYEVRVGQTWDMLRRRKATWADVQRDYENWSEVHHDEPLLSPVPLEGS